MPNPKRLFVAATRQNDGKTMVSLGLYHAFQKHFKDRSDARMTGAFDENKLFIDGETVKAIENALMD